jgi:formylglycine-generating enzyme required for sulfatase activity
MNQCPEMDEVGWYDGNSDKKTHPVGQKLPNAWGLYDMHGNVHEWCLDWYGAYQTSAVTDPEGPAEGEGRVARGGNRHRYASGCRSAKRNFSSSTSTSLGFRVALAPVQ